MTGRRIAGGSPGRDRKRTSFRGLSVLDRRTKKTVAVSDVVFGNQRHLLVIRGQISVTNLDRDFKPTLVIQIFPMSIKDLERVYVGALSKETESPLAPPAWK